MHNLARHDANFFLLRIIFFPTSVFTKYSQGISYRRLCFPGTLSGQSTAGILVSLANWRLIHVVIIRFGDLT